MQSTDKEATIATNDMLRKENRQKRHNRQEGQGPHSYWSTNEGKIFFTTELTPPVKHRNNMRPSGLAVHQPAYETLLECATGGCPVKTGRNCTNEETHAAVMRGPHKYALSDEAIAHYASEAKIKVESKRACLVLYDKIKDDLPKK